MKKFRKSMLTLGTAVAIGGMVAAYAPAFAAGANSGASTASPCSAKPANPCAARMTMHHHGRHHHHHTAMANPGGAKVNPCAAKANPCAVKPNSCAAH